MFHFKEVSGDQILKADAFIGDGRPVPEVDLGRFAQGTNGPGEWMFLNNAA